MALLPSFPNAATESIVLRHGSTFYLEGTLTIDEVPVDLTGMTVRAKVRPDFATAASMTFTCALVSAAAGIFSVTATPTAIATIPVPSDTPAGSRIFSAGAWDVEIEDSAGRILRVIEGDVSVSREATT